MRTEYFPIDHPSRPRLIGMPKVMEDMQAKGDESAKTGKWKSGETMMRGSSNIFGQNDQMCKVIATARTISEARRKSLGLPAKYL